MAAGTEHHSAGTLRGVQELVARGTAAAEVLAVGWQAGDFWARRPRLAETLARTYTLELPGLHYGVVVAATHTGPLSLPVHHFAREGTGKTCWGYDCSCSHGSAMIDVVDLVLWAVTAVEVEESCTSRLVVLAVVQQQLPALASAEEAAAPAQSAAAERFEG